MLSMEVMKAILMALAGTALIAGVLSVQAASSPNSYTGLIEPNYQIATTWWKENPNKWTPVGWKDHLYKFNVLYNGTIVISPERQFRLKQNETNAQFVFGPAIYFEDYTAVGDKGGYNRRLIIIDAAAPVTIRGGRYYWFTSASSSPLSASPPEAYRRESKPGAYL